MERQKDTIHCSVLPSHSVESANQFVQDLQEARDQVKVSQCSMQYDERHALYTLCMFEVWLAKIISRHGLQVKGLGLGTRARQSL